MTSNVFCKIKWIIYYFIIPWEKGNGQFHFLVHDLQENVGMLLVQEGQQVQQEQQAAEAGVQLLQYLSKPKRPNPKTFQTLSITNFSPS